MRVTVCVHRNLCFGVEEVFLNCFVICTHMYSFYEITGESPDSFVDIVCNVFKFQGDAIWVKYGILDVDFQVIKMMPSSTPF